MVSKRAKKTVTIEHLDAGPTTEAPGHGSTSVETRNGPAKPVSHEEPVNPDHLLEFRTNNGKIIKDIFETIKNVLNYSNFVFTQKGLKLGTVDEDQQILVHLTMDPEFFQVYHCQPEALRVGLDIGKLQKAVHMCKANWYVTWIIHKDNPYVVMIIAQNPTKTVEVVNEIDLMDILPYNIQEDIDYDPPPQVYSAGFQEICKLMYVLETTKVNIRICSNAVVFTNIDGTQRQKWSLIVPPGASERPATPVKGGTFPLKILRNFSKASNLSTYVKIYLKEGFPLVCEYELSEHAILRYLLSPFVEEGPDDAQ